MAGEMAVTDAFVHDWVNTHLHELDYTFGIAGAVFVVAMGLWLARRDRGRSAQAETAP